MKNKQKGSLKWIFIIVIAIIIASVYFNFDIQKAIEHEQTQSNFAYIWKHIMNFYNKYLSDKINYLWNNVFTELIWESFIENMKNIKAGELTSLEKVAPKIQID